MALGLGTPQSANAAIAPNANLISQQAGDLRVYANAMQSGAVVGRATAVSRARDVLGSLSNSLGSSSSRAMASATMSFEAQVSNGAYGSAASILRSISSKASAVAAAYNNGDLSAHLAWP